MAATANEPESREPRHICCLGSINVDVTVRLDRLPERHEKIAARETRVGGGGSAANTAVWLSRQGLSVRMLGWVGDDPLGQLALSDLRANGVDTCGVKVLPVASPIAICLSPPDDNRIIVSPVVAAPWSPYDVADRVQGADWLHTTLCEPSFLRDARNAHCAPQAALSLELNGRYDPVFANLADYLFTNSDELARRLKTDDPVGFIKEKHGADRATWFVTQGMKGVAIIAGGKVETVAAIPVEPVDRTGGGDAFNAGAITALSSGADPHQAAEAGLRLAAQALLRLGAH
ncbi:MAG: carbohydrate kinase family protein [Methylocystis sp.]